MTYFVKSHYECVGAGSLLGDEEIHFITEERSVAVGRFTKILEELRDSARGEIATIENNDWLQFDSPYIVWVAVFDLPKQSASVAEILDDFTLRMETDDDLDEYLKGIVIEYSGYSFEPHELTYTKDEAIWSIVEENC
jgi:hypothetical protein